MKPYIPLLTQIDDIDNRALRARVKATYAELRGRRDLTVSDAARMALTSHNIAPVA